VGVFGAFAWEYLSSPREDEKGQSHQKTD